MDVFPKKYLEFLSLGSEIAISIALPILAGYWVDNYLESFPIGLFAGVLMGMALFISRIIQISKKLSSGNKKKPDV